MSLNNLKYLGYLGLLADLFEKLETLLKKNKVEDAEPLELRPSYKGKKFRVTVERLT